MNERIKEDINLLPEKPGCYQMYDINDEIIYIGKAKNLKKRVSQYFLRSQSGKTFAMVSHVEYFKIIITKTEKEAFILEMNLIQKHLPRYNILLKDDKHYPYIALHKTSNPYISIARNLKDKKCTTENSVIYTKILTDFERIGDHGLNIAKSFYNIREIVSHIQKELN